MQQGDSNRSLRSAERSRTEELSRYLTLADDDDAVLAGGVAIRPVTRTFQHPRSHEKRRCALNWIRRSPQPAHRFFEHWGFENRAHLFSKKLALHEDDNLSL